MRSSRLIRQARQGHVRSLTRREYDAAMGRLWAQTAVDAKTPDEIAEAQAQADLDAARGWGYRADEPGSLAVAIRNLELAAAVRPDPYSERADIGAMQCAQDRGDLARRLRGILDRTAKPINSTSEQS